MRINYVGVLAAIVAFTSVIWPWWTAQMSFTNESLEVTEEHISVYPYQVATSTPLDKPETVVMNRWFGWVALCLVIAGGVVGIGGSIRGGKTGRTVLVVAGVMFLLSISFFAYGMQVELSNSSPTTGFPGDLFPELAPTFVSASEVGYSFDYGFWIVVIAAIITFVSAGVHLRLS